MAFFVQSMKGTANAFDKAVTKTQGTVADVVYGTKVDEHKKDSQHLGSCFEEDSSISPNERNLLFKCEGQGHWMVYIRKKGSDKCTMCHYTYDGVKTRLYNHEDNGKYPERKIYTRSYGDIMRFCRGYQKEHPKYDKLEANCRSFCIRLAEYCSVPVHEVNKSFYLPVVSHLAPSSQAYSTSNAIKGSVKGTKEIAKGKVLIGTGTIGGSVVKNTAKVGLSTANQVIDTTAAVIKLPFKFVVNAYIVVD